MKKIESKLEIVAEDGNLPEIENSLRSPNFTFALIVIVFLPRHSFPYHGITLLVEVSVFS